jgi:hypothetical protein
MMGHLSAHGFDPGPSQRPLIAGAATGLVAAIPAGGVLIGFGTLQVVANAIFRLPPFLTGLILLGGFAAAGMIYGALFRRAANDHDGCWLFGLAFGFLLWIAAPLIVLPLIGARALAAGEAGLGFLLGFLCWGLILGIAFPYVHRPLRANLDGTTNGPLDRLGPDVAISERLRRIRRPGPE